MMNQAALMEKIGVGSRSEVGLFADVKAGGIAIAFDGKEEMPGLVAEMGDIDDGNGIIGDDDEFAPIDDGTEPFPNSQNWERAKQSSEIEIDDGRCGTMNLHRF